MIKINLRIIFYSGFLICLILSICMCILFIYNKIQTNIYLGFIGVLITLLSTFLMLIVSINSSELLSKRDSDLIANSIIALLFQKKTIEDTDLDQLGPHATTIADDLANRGLIYKNIKRNNGNEVVYYSLIQK